MEQIRTPRSSGSPFTGPTLPRLAARLGVRLLRRPLRLGPLVIAARHAHVAEVLRRDLDFAIAPINAKRIAAVSGAFVLGMDRSARLASERQALYAALSGVDMAALHVQAATDADALIANAGGGVDVVGGYARRVAGRTAQRLFGVTGPDEATFLDVARAIFAHTFLNLTDDKAVEARAVRAGALLADWLSEEIARRRAENLTGSDLLGALMRQTALDDDGVRRTAAGLLVGSIDTTASAVAKIVHVFCRDRRLGAAAEADAGDLARLRGWCWEALRRWPHNPIVLRQALEDTALAGAVVRKGDRVVAWTHAAMHDPDAFPEPDRAWPDRGEHGYLHFGGGLHPCAGRAVNAWQIPMLVAKLLARGLDGAGRVAWAGPFPDHLSVRLRAR